jgi:hypothetical protein
MASQIMTGGPRLSWSHRRALSFRTLPAAGSTALLRAALSHRSTGCLSTERPSVTSAEFVEFCAMERLCCCHSQQPHTARTSTARFIDASPQTAWVGLFRATFKCELVSFCAFFLSFSSFNLKEHHLEHDFVQPFLCSRTRCSSRRSHSITFPLFMYF